MNPLRCVLHNCDNLITTNVVRAWPYGQTFPDLVRHSRMESRRLQLPMTDITGMMARSFGTIEAWRSVASSRRKECILEHVTERTSLWKVAKRGDTSTCALRSTGNGTDQQNSSTSDKLSTSSSCDQEKSSCLVISFQTGSSSQLRSGSMEAQRVILLAATFVDRGITFLVTTRIAHQTSGWRYVDDCVTTYEASTWRRQYAATIHATNTGVEDEVLTEYWKDMEHSESFGTLLLTTTTMM